MELLLGKKIQRLRFIKEDNSVWFMNYCISLSYTSITKPPMVANKII